MKSLAVVFILLVAASVASAEAFEQGRFYFGPTLGLAYSGFGLGINGEYCIQRHWGIGAEISYTSFSNQVGVALYNAKWKYTFIGVLAAGSYHFTLKSSPKLDPYVKAGLGYFHWGAKYTDSYGNDYRNLYGAGYSSGLGVEGAVGSRYFFKPSLAGRLQVGYPFYLGVGVDFVH